MVVMRIETDVPESRQVTLTLPADVPVGRAELVVSVDSAGDAFKMAVDSTVVRKAYPPRPEHPKLASEYDAFQRKLPELLPSLRGQFVAIHDGQVVTSGPDMMDVALRAYDRCGYQAIYVAEVTDQPQPIPRSGLVREVPKRAGV